MSKIIQWRNGYQAKCDAIKVAAELEKMRKRDGGIQMPAVVNEARPADSPMHNAFDWEDSVAAEKYRIEQARKMVNALQIIVVKGPKAPVKMYSVVMRPDPDPKVEKPVRVYASTEEALADPADRGQILGNAIRDALAFRRKYAALQELAQVIRVIDTFIEKVKA